ncbi:MAG: hypothetical protein H0Z34_14595 [Brevibacillus sp.]|nr:hypothetical protein [Brevibacillus sp.]
MKLYFKEEIGPFYLHSTKVRSVLTEPTYFEVDEQGSITYILEGIQGTGHRYYTDGSIKDAPRRDIGDFDSRGPIILNEEGNALEYGIDIFEVSVEKAIHIYGGDKTYTFEFEAQIYPRTIQLIGENALITLTKRHMVVLVSPEGKVLWSFGVDRCPGEGKKLCVPMFSLFLKESNTVLIADTINSRVLEVNENGDIVWQYGIEGRLGAGPGLVWKPTCARRLPNGNTYIADSKNHRIILVSKSKEKLFELGTPLVRELAFTYPRSIQELPDGSLLLANTHKSNILQINPETTKTLRVIDNNNYSLNINWPRCVRLDIENSEIIIADGLNNRVIFANSLTFEIKHVITTNDDYQIKDPHDIELSEDGQRILISLSDSNSVVEVYRCGKLSRMWSDLTDPHSAKYFEDGIVISNTGNSQIRIIYRNGEEESVSTFITPENKVDQFNRPRFAIRYENGFLVLDSQNHRIVYIEKRSNQWHGYEVPIIYPDSTAVIENLCYPRWLIISKSGDILLTDTENCRILRCQPVHLA